MHMSDTVLQQISATNFGEFSNRGMVAKKFGPLLRQL